ncbi:MAG TPA: MaoC family dehydratase N-terminal domain-containing protein [Vicinamibacterales bacterium]|nr:MaoC family dehydratase N-terminal domain-containing protein [Vicinamibacterales bacterium]
MRSRIGIESEPWTVEVDKTSVRMFARSCQYDDPIFYDEEFARSKGYRSLPAPPHFLGTSLFNPATSDATFGGPRGGGGPRAGNPKLKRILNGGTEIEYFDTIQAGDVLTARSKVADITEREGSIGAMVITTTETTYKRGDTVVAISRGTGIAY